MYTDAQSFLYPSAPRPGFWVSSLIAYGEMASASLVCQVSPSPKDFFPMFH